MLIFERCIIFVTRPSEKSRVPPSGLKVSFVAHLGAAFSPIMSRSAQTIIDPETSRLSGQSNIIGNETRFGLGSHDDSGRGKTGSHHVGGSDYL
jgi:hypothetical protein